ncbi:MAG: DUF4331 domain-containing protein [Phycisphaerae bacterium]|nr:DUF4331 domain-containing protein [Phycisphaerae bacterium]
MHRRSSIVVATLLAGLATELAVHTAAFASSHREAPFITENPKVDATDFYMFRSYEEGKDGYVTIVANYVPLQDPYGGPNYFTLDPDAAYDIHIDSDGDAHEDLTFRFRVTNTLKSLTVPVGDQMIEVPLVNIGPITRKSTAALNVIESYSVELIAGGTSTPITNALTGESTFLKPVDNIGMKSLPDYASYAAAHVYAIELPNGLGTGRMFVGQRKDPFVVNLGEVFDLVNTNPLGSPRAELDVLADKNCTSFILELPIAALTSPNEPVIGGWTTASLRRARVLTEAPSFDKPAVEQGDWVQVSRLGMPLVNEVVIGLKDKNLFNASQPSADGQFLSYVTNPSLPVLLNALFGVTPPCLPRNDLVQVFLTGVPGLNQPANVAPSEMLRLNTSIAPTPAREQSNLGVLAGDLAGYPNGRRPGDDVVDMSLRVVMGALLPSDCAPQGGLPYTDGASVDASHFAPTFPYLLTPLAGSPSNGRTRR